MNPVYRPILGRCPRAIRGGVLVGLPLLIASTLLESACNCGGGTVNPLDGAVVSAYDCTCMCGIGSAGACPLDAGACTFTATVCLRPADQAATFPSQAAFVDLLQSDCDTRICKGTVRASAQELAAPTAAAMGIGPAVFCPLVVCAGTSDPTAFFSTGTCASCPAIPCALPSTVDSCPATTLTGLDAGTIPLDAGFKCCTQAAADVSGCGALPALAPGSGPVRPTAPVCMAAFADPPAIPITGMQAFLTARVAESRVNPATSFFRITPDGDPAKAAQSSVSGRVQFIGSPTQPMGVSAQLRLDQTLSFFFTIPLIIDIPAHMDLSGATVIGVSAPDALSLGGSVFGTIAAGNFAATMRGRVKVTQAGLIPLPPGVGRDRDEAFVLEPNAAMQVRVDFAAGTFRLTGDLAIPSDRLRGIPQMAGRLEVRGTVVNRPPQARAGDDQPTVECTSPSGTPVTLNGAASSDPDGNPLTFTWYRGEALFGTPVAGNASPTVQQTGVGAQSYGLAVTDSSLQSDTDSVSVTVVDTTGPDFRSVTATPTCLWPPEHKYVAYELGTNVFADAVDACDPTAPSIRVVGAQSSDPDNGLGDGDTANDIVFDSNRFCLRAERSGLNSQGRTYTVTLRSVDSHGNFSSRKLMISVGVAHDQSGHDCPALPPSAFVEDGDPRCSFPPPSVSNDPPPQPRGGCSSARSLTGDAVLLLIVAALLAASRRKKKAVT